MLRELREDMSVNKESWDLIITPKKKWLDFGLANIWRYRDLLFLFVRRDIVSQYKQTILGPLWFLIQPITTTIVYTFVFGGLAGLSTDGLPQPLFYIAGITAWTYFSECLIKNSTVFKDNQAIFGKVYFPRIITPLSLLGSNLLKFSIQFVLMICVACYYYIVGYEINPGINVLLVPFFVLFIALQGAGLGMIISSLTIKYRDLSYLVTFGVQLLMYSSPIIYPLSSLSGKFYWIVAANPMTFIVEGFKASTIGVGILTIETFAYSAFISIVIFILGFLVFNKVERNFVDTI